MNAFQFSQSELPIRDDIKLAYAEYWQVLARSGTWWSGAQRVAIAEETRNAVACEFCAERKQALSPYNYSGEHHATESSAAVLPAKAIDAVHRVITDQSRITKSYIDAIDTEGVSHLALVELIGVTVTVFSIDESMRALGLSLEPLPEPIDGEPSRYTPPGLSTDIGQVPMIAANEVGPQERDLWPQARSANVLRALSAVPNAVREWMLVASAQYLTMKQMMTMLADTHRSLNRMQMELVAGRVSSHNECFY